MAAKQPNAPRRRIIYPHRSFRAVPLNPVSIALGVALALLCTMLAFVNRHELASAHQATATWFLSLADLNDMPLDHQAEVFPRFLNAPVPPVSVPASDSVGDTMRFMSILGALFLLIVSKRNTVARGFFYFLLLLLVVGALVLAGFPSIYINAETITQIWLRTAFPVWIIMPWFCAFLFLLVNPDWRTGLGWMALVLVWIFATSALREAFTIALMHYTGILFFPILWLLFGFLFDLLVVLVAYSVSLHWANAHIWGQRKEMTA